MNEKTEKIKKIRNLLLAGGCIITAIICRHLPANREIGLLAFFQLTEGILVYHLILCLGNFPSAKDRQQDSTKMPVWYCISYGFLVCYPYSEIQCIL